MVGKILFWTIIASSLALRIFLFQFYGGDQPTYKEAVEQYYSGQNPYKYTVNSYKTDNTEHGYAYLPTLLYIQTFFYWLNRFFDMDKPLHLLWKIPILISDYLVAFLIYKKVVKTCKNRIFPLMALAMWLFNPYLLTRFEVNTYDIIAIAFLMLGLHFFSSSRNIWAGMFVALAISVKLFCLPVWLYLLLTSLNKKRFLLGTLISALVVCLPFLTSFDDFVLMLNGSIFVHAQRGFQGRPIVGLISFVTQNIGVVLTTPTVFKYLAPMSIIMPCAAAIVLAYKKMEIYRSTGLIILMYLVLTPVLSRTHLYWLFPFFLINLENLKLIKQTAALSIGYLLIYFYLFFWQSGYSFTESGLIRIEGFGIKDTRLYKLYKYGKYQ
jgi:hypothetical protein